MSLKKPLTVEMAVLGDTAKTASPAAAPSASRAVDPSTPTAAGDGTTSTAGPAAAPAVDPSASRAVGPSTSTASDDGSTSIVWILLKVSGGVGIVVVVVCFIMSLMSNKGDQTQASNPGQGNLRISKAKASTIEEASNPGQGNLRISNAKASTIEEVAEPLNFFLWNPHWECFEWNQEGCAGHVLDQMRDTLKEKRVDFAAGIMMHWKDLGLPEGYMHTRHSCGKDVVDLIYDSRRWKAIIETKKVGCMESSPSDRPYVIQEFVPVGSDADSEPIAIIAAHFPHPFAGIESFEKNIANTVGEALMAVRDASPKLQRVALIADTNTDNIHPSSKIASWLGMPGGEGAVQASELKRTCCSDVNFPPEMTYDRVIVNFGEKIETQVWFDDGKDLPSWTCQKQPGSRCRAFHKPVLATVYPPAPSPIEANLPQ